MVDLDKKVVHTCFSKTRDLTALTSGDPCFLCTPSPPKGKGAAKKKYRFAQKEEASSATAKKDEASSANKEEASSTAKKPTAKGAAKKPAAKKPAAKSAPWVCGQSGLYKQYVKDAYKDKK
eukprot:CAMPEP_0116942060 /NCGR_PEP_ID=MMETSP0467-20121206/34369_1 /TAXON_ID=283647 /ORGANISM="Mesodinium pulex, Strain SPMC105" /LENGTH=120 /DNA_ID=CAMNT_0004624983 /DNA_START=386 /DNA_END=748 /DNA_ORIENTATION=+